MGHLTSPSQFGPIKTLKNLDNILTVLGSTKTTFFPFIENVEGSIVEAQIHSYGENAEQLISRDEAGVVTLNAQFSPYRHVGGVHSYEFDAASSQYLDGTDNANIGFPSNADFSCGAWIYARDITAVTIMGKYDVNVQREWRLSLDSSSKIELESYDETNNEDRTGASDTAVTVNTWAFVVATTDGADSDASMTFYLNGTADGTGNTESGAGYASQPDTSAAFAIGATLNTTPAVTALFDGRIALPFVCGKILTAANVSELFVIGQELLGL